ncbi:MAG TPA: sigma-54 dependent transcriptional regulator [Bryobacteraceae bacterium]|nr:sigma-54 dependent transcriptional regulator [Bryobacteraceae bacterium]
MRAGTSIWVIEEGEGLTPCIRNECPGLAVAAVSRDRIAAATPVPNLAVVDATERERACSSIRELRRRYPAVPVLIVSPASKSEPLPEDFDDFVIAPFQPGELRLRLARLSGECRDNNSGALDDESVRQIRSKYHLDAVIGESAALREAIRKVPRLGASEAIVLITGETGTGKELFARAVHYASARRDRPFVPVNCGALPDTLFENELFGHEKGAYTDASTAGFGLLGIAEGGSLFLDEVDSLSLASQAKLLRVLQDREYRPLGSQRSLKANVRIIAAANTPLADRVLAREFRADLYYRLHVLALKLPALVERREDIPILARHFLARFAKESRRPAPRLSPEAMRRLMEYAWPGNIRELESTIQRALVLSDGAVLDASSIDLPDSWAPPAASSSDSPLGIVDAVYRFEREYLTDLLFRLEGNVTRAAKVAGKDRRTFQRLLRRHGIPSRPQRRCGFTAAPAMSA